LSNEPGTVQRNILGHLFGNWIPFFSSGLSFS
jgi:hypothetical protein